MTKEVYQLLLENYSVKMSFKMKFEAIEDSDRPDAQMTQIWSKLIDIFCKTLNENHT